MLNGVLSLGDIRNVEKACDRIVEQALYRAGTHAKIGPGPQGQKGQYKFASPSRRGMLSAADREDAVAFLISEAWLLWSRYDPQHPGGAKFSTFAYPQLRCRLLDWYRRKLGRGAGPGEWGVSSLDVLLEAIESDDTDAAAVLGLVAFASCERDDPAARVSAVDGLVRAGGGRQGGVVDAGGGAADGRVAQRGRGAGERQGAG